jgi:hypothetical protein
MAARAGETTSDMTSIKSAAAVTPSDSTDIYTGVTRGLYVGATGDVSVIFAGDADASSVVLTGLAAGVWHPIQVRRVLSTGTTATSIVAGY